MKFKEGSRKTRNRSIFVVLYAIYVAFILASAVPYIAQDMTRGYEQDGNFHYNVVIEQDGDDIAHYLDVVRADNTQPGVIDLVYYPGSHTLDVDASNIQSMKLDCESFYKDEAQFLLGKDYASDPSYYEQWFRDGGNNGIDPFTVNVVTDTGMDELIFDGVPLPVKVDVTPVGEPEEDWWAEEGTKYTKSGDTVTVNQVPEGSTLVEIYFQSPDNIAPTADFTFVPPSPGVDQAVSFDASASEDTDGTIVEYLWDFGDTSADETGVTVTHTYTATNTYSVKLTVRDDDGASDTKTKQVTVSAEPAVYPTADFTMPTTGGTVGTAVTFDASDSSDDGSIVSYTWDWGDGSTLGTGETTTHTYTKADTYTVELTVTDDTGLTGTFEDDIVIKAAPKDDDDDDEESMLGLGKVAGIDLLWIILIIVIIVIVIAAGAAASRKKKPEEEELPPEAPPAAPPEAGPPAEMPAYPPEGAPPPAYPGYEEPMAPPPMEEAPPTEEMMPPTEEPMPTEETELPPTDEGLPSEEAELPEEELPEDELSAEEVPIEAGEEAEAPAPEPEGEGEAAPPEEPAPEPEGEGGAEAEAGAEMTACPACGTSIPVGVAVCPNCNSEFEW